MSYARGTEHYNLPQTVGTDKRDWFDTNKPFEDIDADLYSAKQTADSAASDIASLTTRVGTVEGDISALSTRVGTAEGNISALQGSVTGLGNDLADVKADLRDAICSVVEPDATADYAHAVDSYFWYNDTLYITTVAIAVGDTIVPNTNCNTTNITSEIVKTLNNIGDLSQLTTNNKNSAVEAINEINTITRTVLHAPTTAEPYTIVKTDYVAEGHKLPSFAIDTDKCIKCGVCIGNCKFKAISKQ